MLRTEVPQLKSDVSRNYGALGSLSRTVRQGLGPLQSQVQVVAGNVLALKNQTSRLGTDALTQVSPLALLAKTQLWSVPPPPPWSLRSGQSPGSAR